MIRRKIGVRAGANTASLHFANRNAYLGMGISQRARSASAAGTARHLEQACVRLQDATDELETALSAIPSPDGRADLHEAIGSIMETLRLIAAAHARLERPQPDFPAAAE